MSTASSLLAGFYRLPPALNAVTITRSINIPADDGVVLKTDLFQPRTSKRRATILMRVPYGRTGFDTVAEIYAERGFNTVLQACRGTGGSGGTFDPLSHEREDGLATIEWIKAQDWFDGRLGMSGPSYLGYAQWAICDAPEISAMAIKVSSAEFESVVFPGGAFALQLWLSWLQTIEGLRGAPLGAGMNMVSGEIERRTRRAANTLPLVEADVAAVGHKVPFWRRWFAEAIDNKEFWEPLDQRKRLGPDTPPNHLVSGWYDFMLDQLLRDYQILVAHGHRPFLTIGTWHHIDNDLQRESIVQTLSWMQAHLNKDPSALRKKPVRLHISGGVGWREFDAFPPAEASTRTMFLTPAALSGKAADTAPPSTYAYDPADPTPNFGGAVFAFTGAGARNNRKLEARDDVLCFTSQPLKADMTVIGHVSVRLFVRSGSRHTDFFARLCDVSTAGTSTNITDNLRRVSPETHKADANGVICLDMNLHACAHRFKKGHRIRLQVSSGAHPRFARNFGTGEPIGSATEMILQHQEIFHDSKHSSRVDLPVHQIS